MPAEYCDVQFGRFVVEEIHHKNPRGLILVVKPDGSVDEGLSDPAHGKWTLPRYRWHDNGIDSPVKALVRSVHDYLPNLKLCWDNVVTWPSEICSRTPHIVNGVRQEITPCTYDLTMNTTYSRENFPVPQPLSSADLMSSSSSGKHVTPFTGRWGDAFHDWTSSDEEEQ